MLNKKIKDIIEKEAESVISARNTEKTRRTWKKNVEFGIKDFVYEYLIVCSEENNDYEVISENKFVAEIFYKECENSKPRKIKVIVQPGDIQYETRW